LDQPEVPKGERVCPASKQEKTTSDGVSRIVETNEVVETNPGKLINDSQSRTALVCDSHSRDTRKGLAQLSQPGGVSRHHIRPEEDDVDASLEAKLIWRESTNGTVWKILAP
jgi:hypothetical protein